MICCRDIEDYYKGGLYLRRWEMVDGFPRCTVDALPVASLDPGDVSTQETANAVVRDALEDLEAYQAALKLNGQEEPERLVLIGDGEGGTTEITNPAWTAWEEARLAVANVSAGTLALYELRVMAE